MFSLSSTANLTRRHFACTAVVVQLKDVISQNTLMTDVELELTSFKRETEGEKEMACCVCSIPVLWFSDSTANTVKMFSSLFV